MRRTLAVLAFAAAASHPAAHAVPGVTASEILIGQDVDLTGSIAVRMKPLLQAADAYFDKVNAAGGVHGRKIKVVRLDSNNKPDKTKENLKQFEKQDVFALWATSGTGNVGAALSWATERGVPMIASTSGADTYYTNKHAVLVNLKASYGDEIRRMVAHLRETYVSKVAILSIDNGFGREATRSAQDAIKANNLELVSLAAHKEDGSDIAATAQKVAQANPPAVLLLTLSGPAPKVVDEYVKTGHRTQLFALSIIAADALNKAVGDKSRGVIVTQVVPFPSDRNVPLVREYQDLVKAKGVKDYSHAGVEGYLYARGLVEGLQAAGRNLTREGLIAAFKKMDNRDLGGIKLQFGPTDHNGSDFVEITMIGRDGRLVR